MPLRDTKSPVMIAKPLKKSPTTLRDTNAPAMIMMPLGKKAVTWAMSWQTLQVPAMRTMNRKEPVTRGSCSCSCLSPGEIQKFSARRIL